MECLCINFQLNCAIQANYIQIFKPYMQWLCSEAYKRHTNKESIEVDSSGLLTKWRKGDGIKYRFSHFLFPNKNWTNTLIIYNKNIHAMRHTNICSHMYVNNW